MSSPAPEHLDTLSFLQIEKPIIFFDLETTGTDMVNDRVVEISAIKLLPGGSQQEIHYYINPTIPIPADATRVHGITNERVAAEPTFAQKADELAAFFKNCDLGGYNIRRFDVPLLMQEFDRCKKYPIHLSEVRIVDAMNIFYKKEKRDLASAVRFYCNEEHINAHSARADVLATMNVLKHQLLRYNDLEPNASFLHQFTNDSNDLDFSGKFVRTATGEVLFNFGQHKGKPALSEIDYLQWMLDASFTVDTRMVAKRLLMNHQWQREINAWLQEHKIIPDLQLAYSLYQTITTGTAVHPFSLTTDGNTSSLSFLKGAQSIVLPLPHSDAKDILAQILLGYFDELGGLDFVKSKV